jgi:hypothetical protein
MTKEELDKKYEIYIKWDHGTISREKYETLYLLDQVARQISNNEFFIATHGDEGSFDPIYIENLYDQYFLDMGWEEPGDVRIMALVKP